jgi:hypothetical protein
MDIVSVYQQLAEFEDQRGENQPRDRFLILAADAALAHGDNDRAEQIRRRLLDVNPHHLLKPYPSFADALKAPDVFGYVADLRHSYPPAEAERLLASVQGGQPAPETEPFPPPPAESAGPAGPTAPEAEEPPIYPLSRTESVPEQPAVPPPPTAPSSRPPPRLVVEPEVSAPEDVYPLPQRSPPKPRRQQQPGSVVSDWVASFLFAILLLAAMGLASYTLARPFFTP